MLINLLVVKMIENPTVKVIKTNLMVVVLILGGRLVIFFCTHRKLNIIKLNKSWGVMGILNLLCVWIMNEYE